MPASGSAHDQGSCKSGMTEAGWGYTLTGGTFLFIIHLRLVESYSPAVPVFQVGTGFIKFQNIRVNELLTAITATIQVHLHDLRQVIRIGKDPCMTAHTAQHGCSRIMDIALQQLSPEDEIIFGGHNTGF